MCLVVQLCAISGKLKKPNDQKMYFKCTKTPFTSFSVLPLSGENGVFGVLVEGASLGVFSLLGSVGADILPDGVFGDKRGDLCDVSHECIGISSDMCAEMSFFGFAVVQLVCLIAWSNLIILVCE